MLGSPLASLTGVVNTAGRRQQEAGARPSPVTTSRLLKSRWKDARTTAATDDPAPADCLPGSGHRRRVIGAPQPHPDGPEDAAPEDNMPNIKVFSGEEGSPPLLYIGAGEAARWDVRGRLARRRRRPRPRRLHYG